MKTRKQFLIAGFKSGLHTGFSAGSLIAIFMTIYMSVVEWDVRGIIYLPFSLAYAVPVGLIVGGLLGLVIGWTVYKNQRLIQNMELVATIAGGVIGGMFPVFLLVLELANPSTIDRQGKLTAAIVFLITWVISGVLAGRWGSKRFVRYINQTDEELVEVIV